MSNIVLESSWRGRIDDLLGRRRDTWVMVAGLAAVVLLGLVLWGRGATARIAPPATSPATGVPGVQPPSPSPVIFVDVAGAVRAPGLYTFPPGTRVADALTAARGARARADLSSLNLAQVLTDGMKLVVPARGSGADASSPAPTSESTVPGPVSLNSADQAALETVPGVGPVTALAILAYRERVGAFESVDQLLEIDGIGPATLEQIRPYVGV